MLVLKLTKAGLNAALNAQSVGLKLDLNLIKFGSGKYNVVDDDPRTAMVSPFLTAAIVGGGIEPESHTLRFNSAFKDNQARDVYEVGIFTSTNVLFAVASTTDKPFFTTSKTLTTVFASGFRLGAFDSSIVQVVLDPQGAIALQLFAQHEASNNPHPQYAKGKDVEDLTENIDKDFVKKSQVTNNLDSSSTENVLSAAMGKKLLDDSIWRVFFGQMTATQSSSSDNTNTYIRMLDRNLKPFGGSTRIYGIGNVVIATSGEQLIVNGKLNNTLTSNATDEALTAQQGKVLKDSYDTFTYNTSVLITNYVNNLQDQINNKYDKTGGTVNGNVAVNGVLQINADSAGGDVTIRPNSLTHGQETQINTTSGSRIDCYYFDKPIRAPKVKGGAWETLTGETVMGIDQDWRNVTGSRALNTTYYNTSGKLRFVAVSVRGGSIRNKAYVNDVMVSDQMTTYNSGWPSVVTIFPVSPGRRYELTAPYGQIEYWAEWD